LTIKQIIILTDGIYPTHLGGMQKHSWYLAKSLAAIGVKVKVFFPGNDNVISQIRELLTTAENQHIIFKPIRTIPTFKFPGHYLFENFLFSNRMLSSLEKEDKPVFVYAQGFSAWALLNRRRKLNNLTSTPIGLNFHGLEMFQKAPNFKIKLQHLFLRPATKFNIKRADVLFSLGGKLTEIHKKIAPGTAISEIPIGITSDWLVRPVELKTNNSKGFVFIGRYERRKGIEELSYVLKTSDHRIDNAEFHFIGPIPENKQIKNLPNIKYYGAINDENRIKEILRNCDVLICPSWSEGMPTVILEAMASGCAIIATDVGAVSEQVDASNGILIEPGNKPELKAAIERMIALPAEQLLEMKKASIKRVEEKFLWDKVAELTISEIKKIIKNCS
jgi:glycosyltransferase involved in cell wall biosynthesis